MEVSLDRQDVTKALNIDPTADLMYRDPFTDQFQYFMCDDDEDFGGYASDPESREYSQINNVDFHAPELHSIIEEVVLDGRQGELVCTPESEDIEPIDFESNGVLWLPPEPEDEEDKRQDNLFVEPSPCGLNYSHEASSDTSGEKEVFSASGNDCSDLSSAKVDGKQVIEEAANIQSIVVLLSSRCVWKGTVCERPHLIQIKYYSNFDKPLGRHLCDSLFDQVTITKSVNGGKEQRMYLLVMENLLYGRNLKRLYDPKGSLGNKNLIEAMPTSPIFVGNKAKRLLERAVWNDTSFLASIGVMDYSLLVGIGEEKHELVVGIINFIGLYKWDKQLEAWIKASNIFKNASTTLISPRQYRKRFRKAMTTYFLTLPNQSSPPTIIPSMPQEDLAEENAQGSINSFSRVASSSNEDPTSYANPSVLYRGPYVRDSYLDEPSPCKPGESLVDPDVSDVESSSLVDKVHSLYWLVVNRILHCIVGVRVWC